MFLFSSIKGRLSIIIYWIPEETQGKDIERVPGEGGGYPKGQIGLEWLKDVKTTKIP